jgi:4-diphosphocytidyl-2-C-methyl-D-erythritol kinase
VLAPGKVNLCLLVGAPRRSDGLHQLVSVVQPTRLADEVTIERGGPVDSVVCPGVGGENLALTAVNAFREATGWDGPPQRITIRKRIPIAGGMAGGSSDAAAALTLIAEVAGIAIPRELPMALGADVPVMMGAVRALMTGAGEHVEPLPGAAPPLVVVPLEAELGAGQVYAEFDAHDAPRSPEELERAAQRIRDGEIEHVNDLERAARRLCPAIDPALEALREAGVERPMVTGSGPTVFGVSEDPEVVDRLHAAGYHRAVVA